MPNQTFLLNSFTGWSPNDDAINGGRGTCLQMTNLEFDRNGALSLQNGTTVKQTIGAANAHTLFSKFLQGVRHDYTSLVDGSVYRDGSLLTAGGSTSRTAFSTAFDDTLIASGAYRVKDSGTAVSNLGVTAPTLAPTLTQFPYTTSPLIANATDTNGYHGVFASLVDVGGYDFLEQWQCDTTDFLFVFATFDSANTTDTTVLAQTTVGTTTTESTPNDFIDVTLFSIDGSGNPDNSGVDMNNVSAIQFAIYLSRPSSLTPTIEFASDYYTYNWTSDLGPNGDDIRVVSGSKISFRIRRQQFTRVGGNTALDWNDVVGYVVGIQCVGAMANPAGISIPQTFQGGDAGSISGTGEVQVQYAQMNVAVTNSYTAKSTLGPAAKVSNIENLGFALVPQVPTDPQVTNIWIFRQDNGLSEWYRVLDIPIADVAANTIDTTSDTDALVEDVTVDLTLVSTFSIDTILEILGPIGGRWYYFTSSFLYPSDINDPDLINVQKGVRTCGGQSEVFLWARKITESQILVGTSIDIYLLSGTFRTLPDGSIDISYLPLGCKFPPLSRDANVFSGQVYYLSTSGWTSISTGGSNQILSSPGQDLLYQGETRYGYTGLDLPGIAPGSVNFPSCIQKGKLYCTVTGTGRIEVFDFIRQYWRPVEFPFSGDCNAICETQDGQVLGYFSDNKLRVLFDETTKLIDGATNQAIQYLSTAQDGGVSRNRKNLFTFKSRLQNTSGNLTVQILTDQGTITLSSTVQNGTLNSEFALDISSKLEAGKWWQFQLSGSFADFLLQDLSVDCDVLPTPLTSLIGLSNNFGTGSKKRVRTWPFVIDTRNGIATLTPYVDGVAQTPISVQTTYKATVLYKFLTDVFGIDYGYKIMYDGATLFEFYGEQSPEVVQVLPVAKRFDQIGPQEFFRYGKVQKLNIRLMPIDDTQDENVVLVLPYTVYFNDQEVLTGSIDVLNKAEGSYTIGTPKGTAGAILRVEFGPVGYDLHRFNTKFLVTESGNETEGKWVTIG